MVQRLSAAFSKNRSEEVPEDNWEDFIVPPFLPEISIKDQTKAMVIMGGRGCGKTALLRYFSHAAQFSSKRLELPDDILRHVGLYWRADTNFLNAFVGGEQSSETWRKAFEHLLACELGREIFRALHSLNCNPQRKALYGRLDILDFTDLAPFGEFAGKSIAEVERVFEQGADRLAAWVNNIEILDRPIFLPAERFLRKLVEVLKKQLPYLENTIFAVFIDEYENLRDEQQVFINGLIKHGSKPLIYNIAMKRNGWRTKNTIGPESIQEISDYRVVDLEKYLEKDFNLFAAELIMYRIGEFFPASTADLPISSNQLREIACVDERYGSGEYRDRVLARVNEMLPRVNEKEAAKIILSDNRLKAKLKENVERALRTRGENIPAEQFIIDEFPEVSVIMPALISRSREIPASLIIEINSLRQGELGRFSPSQPLLSNNLFGCVNLIYLSCHKTSILFSGFATLLLISRGNIRHLFELIHRIFGAIDEPHPGKLPVAPPSVQAEEIRSASENILGTVKGYGTYGPQLYALSLCLGSIFRERHRSIRQSEPEINHFTISQGTVSAKFDQYISEAEKWSVLFLASETKMKSVGAVGQDYIFNPIFSPYFQISYRKKRSIQISVDQLLQMFEADQARRDALVREFSKGEADGTDLFSSGDEG